jgi:hypothetical protein
MLLQCHPRVIFGDVCFSAQVMTRQYAWVAHNTDHAKYWQALREVNYAPVLIDLCLPSISTSVCIISPSSTVCA